MKKIYIPFIAAALVLPTVTLTGCLEETIPTDRVTQDQVTESPFAASSTAMAMPAFMNTVFVLGDDDRHFDCGYAQMMHVRDVMTGDLAVLPSGYDWFNAWELNQLMGESYIYNQSVWNFYTKLVQTANNTIGAIDPEITERAGDLYYLGTGYAYRAMAYLDMARMYEYLPTDGTSPINADGNTVTGLTVPIVTEKTTETEARENPRATHDDMLAFILEDLDNAEKYIVEGARPSKTLPDLAVVYGLKARAYMWDEDYAKAQEYAAKAIAEHKGSPMTESQWLSTTTGFNDIATPSWMLGMQYVAEDGCVLTGIINWTSWSSNEYTTGYSAAAPYLMIDASLYNQISNEDFRKLTFIAPKGSSLEGRENFIDKDALPEDMTEQPYVSLKIKPGQGNMTASDIACAVGVPLMRVEEMYFIQAEAAAHQNPAEGKQLIETFMKTYRYDSYVCEGTTEQEVVDEIFLQKRVEFFLEGIIFFDYKRLDKPVIRHYEGTNWTTDRQFNTTTRPAWMNFCMVQTEGNNNKAVKGWNNPDPSDCYETLGVN